MLLAVGILMIVLGATGLRSPRPGSARTGRGADGASASPNRRRAAPHSYPLRLDGRLDEDLSRWLWLVKWFLAIPHYIVLAFLWLAFGVLTRDRVLRDPLHRPVPARSLRLQRRRAALDVAGVASTRSARSGRTATRRSRSTTCPTIPPGSTSSTPSDLSRGLVLVKWWLLAIPQYIVVGLLGGGLFTTAHWSRVNDHGPWHGGWSSPGGGLIGILVTVAAVILLFANRYPNDLFRLVMGLNRWVFRVAAYAALMTDEYPPFRLDQGGRDPGTLPGPVPDPEPQPEAPPLEW